MKNFYQITSKSDIDGRLVGFFVENSEIYNTYDEALKRAEKLAIAMTQEPFNKHLIVQYQKKDNKTIIEVFNPRIDDILIEYHVQKLTVK